MNRQFADDLDTDLARGHVLEWAEIYALDAISADERRTIDAFLQDADPTISGTFANRVRTCRETLATAYATDELEPPSDLFERIVAQLPTYGADAATGVASEPAPAPSAPERDGVGLVAGDGAPKATGFDELAERRSRKASMSSRAARWVVASAAAVVIAVGGVTVAQNLQPDSVEQQVLQASDVRTEQLALEPGGMADVAVSGEEDAAVVTLSGVPAPAEGFVYQMWRIPADGTAPVSVGTMSGEDVAGSKVTELTGISGFSAVAITVEPEGGSAEPTLPIVAQIPLEV